MNSRYPTPMPRKRRPRAWAFATGVTIAYCVGILVLAFVAGVRLHDWARLRIVQSSILATLADDAPASAAHSTPIAAAPVAAESSPGQSAPSQPVTPEGPESPAINVLLLGTDERPDESGPSRTDTMILLTLDPQRQTAGILSLPRDLWVPIPGQGITTKINTAYLLGEVNKYPGGGPQLAKDTVSSFIGRPVDYYLRVNFDGFREIIDLIGGIDVAVPMTIHDEEYPTQDYGVETFHLDAGLQHLDGTTALKYARTRHSSDDYSRSRRQQDIIRAVAEKVLNANMIPQLVSRAPALLMTMQNSIQTDIPMPTALELTGVVRNSSLQEIRQLVLDSKYGQETYSSEGAWILVPDRAKVRVAMDQFFASAADPASTQGVAAGDASSIQIEILNGTTQPGVAATTAQLLEAHGWNVASIGDADRSDYAQTIVINYGAPDSLIQRLSSDLHLETNMAKLDGLNSTAGVDMRIVVGNDLLPLLK